LIETFSKPSDDPQYTRWYGSLEALMACHVSPVHYFIRGARRDWGRQSSFDPAFAQNDFVSASLTGSGSGYPNKIEV
jgi:hypothetical protein